MRIVVVGLGAAVTVGLGSGTAFADMATTGLPDCAVTPDGGCVTGPAVGGGGGGMPSDWVADQFTYYGTSYLGEDFYVRNDNTNAARGDMARLARDLGYAGCRVVFVMNGPNEAACW